MSILKTRMLKLLPRLTAAALAAPMCAALLAHAYVGLFSRYWYDDFNTAAVLRERGFLGSQLYWYLNWSGRFSFHFAVNLAESAGPWVVSLLPLAALSAWAAATAWAAYQAASLLGLPRRAGVALLSALLLVYATVESTADVAQSLYWQTGMLTYLAPLIFFTANAGLVASSARKEPGRAAPWRICLCALLALVAGGFSEVSAVLQAGGMSLLLAASLTRRRGLCGRGTRALILSGFTGSLAALLIVALAPGNGVRRGLGPEPAGLFWSAESSCRYALYFFEQHTRRWRGVALLCFVLPAWAALSLGTSRLSRLGRPAGAPCETPDARGLLRLLAYGTAAGFVLIVLCFIPGFYVQSEALPRRAHIIPKFVLVCVNAYWGALAGLALLRAARGRKSLTRSLPWVLALPVAVLLVVSPVISARRTFALGARARDYAERWDEAERQIRAAAAAGARDVTVRAVEGVEWELGFGRPELRLSRDPKAPQNVAAAKYYGIDSVKAE
jgi:type IV secretory pathway VirB2 component (pilin)